MEHGERLRFLDNLRTFLIFLVVLYHAGLVYESSGFAASFWIVDDPSVSKTPGLLNIILDIFVMPTIFFISGFFTPGSYAKHGPRQFIWSKFRRLVIPWGIALLTLMPLYKVIFLYSRGLPQENWTTYFHFSNGILGMSWLWFLPALFLFDVLYTALQKLNLSKSAISMRQAVAAIFVLGVGSSVVASIAGWTGWTKTPLIDFQNERLLPYFLLFLFGSLCYRLGVLESDQRNMKLYVAVNATAWIPINVYVITLINFIFHPGEPIISLLIDLLLLWVGFYLSLFALLYSMVTTFKYFFNRQRRLGMELASLSYGVYIMHMPVMGLIAVVLLNADLPGFLKYGLLTLSTYAASNAVVWVYGRFKRTDRPLMKTEDPYLRSAGNQPISTG